VKAVAGFGLLLLLLGLVARAVFSTEVVTSTLPARQTPAFTAAAGDSTIDRRAQPDDGGAVDLYGNEVNDAIAAYSLDPAGSLYELHSPQTELPRLGSPKS
jgi:hypothetical protein